MYSHRNGETDAPTVGGRYWFSGHRTNHAGNRDRIQDMVEVDDRGNTWDGDGYKFAATKYEGQWWGPVMPPWESDGSVT